MLSRSRLWNQSSTQLWTFTDELSGDYDGMAALGDGSNDFRDTWILHGSQNEVARVDDTMIARALLVVFTSAALAVAASSCSKSVSESSGGGGHGGSLAQGGAPPNLWCSVVYGVVQTEADGLNTVTAQCQSDEVCALDGQMYQCCSIANDHACGNLEGTGSGKGLYRSPQGWAQLPIPTGYPGMICKPSETCAMHSTTDCRQVCCDPRQDPDCGVPLKQCCGQC